MTLSFLKIYFVQNFWHSCRLRASARRLASWFFEGKLRKGTAVKGKGTATKGRGQQQRGGESGNEKGAAAAVQQGFASLSPAAPPPLAYLLVYVYLKTLAWLW